MSILTFSIIVIVYLAAKKNKYVDIIKRLYYELDEVEGLIPHDVK